MSYRIGSMQVSKVQLALMVGTPLAIGLGFYIYKRMRSGPSKDDATNSNYVPKTVVKELERKEKNTVLEQLKEATTYKNNGNDFYRNGKYDEAITCYAKAIEKCPIEKKIDLAIFYQNRAAANEMLQRWSAVKDDCTRSLEHNPRYIKAYFRRAKAHEMTNDLLSCLDDVTATIILETFRNKNTIIYADRILQQSGLEEAELAMRTRTPTLPSSNYIDTYMRSFINDPLQKMPLPVETITEPARGFMRAKLAFENGRHEEVIAACTEEIESSEAESQYKTEALLLRGTFHLLCGAYDEATQDLDAVINNADASKELRSNALIKRASLNYQLKKKDSGLADFKEAINIMPDNADIYHHRAQIYLLIDQMPNALEEFERVMKLAPKHGIAFVQKCYIDYRMALKQEDEGRLARVMIEFGKAIENFPDCIECVSLMAQVLRDQQQFAQADLFYEKAIQMAPKNAPLYVHRGILMLQWHGDVKRATELMMQALKVDDKCELAYETLGTVEVQRANLELAVELFDKALKLAKTKTEMGHLFALRNAALAQIKITAKLGIDMATMSAMALSDSAFQ